MDADQHRHLFGLLSVGIGFVLVAIAGIQKVPYLAGPGLVFATVGGAYYGFADTLPDQ